MIFKLACADFTFPLLPHDNVLQLVAMLGFEGVDVGLFEERSHLWPSREFADIGRTAAEMRQKLDAVRLKPADIFLQLAPDFVPYAINQPDEARRKHARDRFQQALEYASACGCGHVTTLPGVHFDEEPFEASFARTVAELQWRVELARRHNIVFGVEAHVGSIAPDPALAERLAQSVDGLTLTLDYTHFTRAGLPDSAVEPLMRYAGHFHVRGAREGRLQTPITQNTIDYGRVAELMRASGYNGWVGIEYVWIDWEHCNECDNLSETILFRDLFRRFSSAI